MAEDEARVVALSIRRTDEGAPAFRLETPFGENVQVLPRPPRFEAVVTLAWDGAIPEEVAELVARAKAAGVRVEEGE
jgi:hypothetical protein